MGEPPRVDVRFLLANERTLLAWVRTALALLAAGGAIYEFTEIDGRKVFAILLAVVGIAAAAAGAARYADTARAIESGEEIERVMVRPCSRSLSPSSASAWSSPLPRADG
jgi:putative membrane protein